MSSKYVCHKLYDDIHNCSIFIVGISPMVPPLWSPTESARLKACTMIGTWNCLPLVENIVFAAMIKSNDNLKWLYLIAVASSSEIRWTDTKQHKATYNSIS